MARFHKNLTQAKWNSMPKDRQILNIASELLRVKGWLEKGDKKYMQNCADRAFELIDLTAGDKKWHKSGLGELLRLREVLGEFYIGIDNIGEFTMPIRALLDFNKISARTEL